MQPLSRPEWTWPTLFDCPTCPALRGQLCQTKSRTGAWTGSNRGYHPARKALVQDMTAEQARDGFAALDAERAAGRAEMRQRFAATAADPAIAATRAAINATLDQINRDVVAAERQR
jgi:hypothetical protein